MPDLLPWRQRGPAGPAGPAGPVGPLSGLTDVDVTGLTDRDMLTWDQAAGRFKARRKPYFDVHDLGAVGDGLTHPLSEVFGSLAAAQVMFPFVTALTQERDWAAWEQAARLANTVGGGRVMGRAATYLVDQPVDIFSNVTYDGAGVGATTIKARDGSNTDVLRTDQFAALTGGGTAGGPSRFTIRDLRLDGNRANNATGWPLRIYGRAYRISKLIIENGASGNAYSEWGGGGSEMESHWNDFHFADPATGTTNFVHAGPHDSQFVNGEIVRTAATSGGKGIDLSGLGDASTFNNVHAWGPYATAWELGRRGLLSNCQAEGATGINLLVAASGSVVKGGMFFGAGVSTPNAIGIQIGDAGRGVGNCNIDTHLHNFVAGGFPINFVNTFGFNRVRATVKAGTETAAVNGVIGGTDHLEVLSDGGGGSHSRVQFPLAGNIDVRGRPIFTGAAAVIAPAGNFAAAAAGAAGASELAASLSATAAAAAPAAGGVLTFTFPSNWPRTPRAVLITPQNQAAAQAGLYISAKAVGAVTVSCLNAPAANAVLLFDLLVIG